MNDGCAIRLEDVSAGYSRQAVLTGVSLCFAPAKVTLLIGPNGAGKSTLLSTLYGLTDLLGGRIVLGGRDVTALPAWERRRLGIGLVPQGRANFPEMSVRENLLIAAEETLASGVREAIDEICERFPFLRKAWRSTAGNLSGGQQQLLEMAMVLLGKPKVLLLDEPSLGLSPAWQADVFGVVPELTADGITVIMVEQNVMSGLEVADNAVLMEQGQVVLEGPPEAIRDTEELRAAYLGAPAGREAAVPPMSSGSQEAGTIR